MTNQPTTPKGPKMNAETPRIAYVKTTWGQYPALPLHTADVEDEDGQPIRLTSYNLREIFNEVGALGYDVIN